ncbi:Uncharacterised protein [Mycobacterium tuberculosis]|uniref:Uncharacterized protein n=1 Tax=Mycobacterium tuberculosis TaxID=1773 RepID=A0A916LHP1_MYCTX|nr:Uncharacterised protein [Mycobacterium tuberculosis]
MWRLDRIARARDALTPQWRAARSTVHRSLGPISVNIRANCSYVNWCRSFPPLVWERSFCVRWVSSRDAAAWR